MNSISLNVLEERITNFTKAQKPKLSKWADLDFWHSGEWQVVEEKLNDLSKSGVQWLPGKDKLFAALKSVRPEHVRVVIIGQDPYPRKEHATGIAFSIPVHLGTNFPPTLINVFDEMCADLGCERPCTGDLSPWVKQGVLLWNCIPSCTAGKPASHHWPEWEYLTREIVEKLDGQVVFVLLGSHARFYNRYILKSVVLETSHPSPLGVVWGFRGSRIFSRTNDTLVTLGKVPIDWGLPCTKSGSDLTELRREHAVVTSTSVQPSF